MRKRATPAKTKPHENWLSSPTPTREPAARNKDTGFLVTGQVPGDHAVRTATDVPLSAYGRGAAAFAGLMDNTDVFFKLAKIAGVR